MIRFAGRRTANARSFPVLVSCALLATAATAQREAETFHVAIGLYRRGLHDEAAKQFRRFLRERPRHALAAEAWYRLGACCLEVDRPDEAIGAFERALGPGKDRRFRAECQYRLGKTLQSRGRHAAASKALQSLVEEVEQGHYLRVPALYADGECRRELGQKKEALTCFLEAAAGDPDKSGKYGMPARYYAGFLLMELERYEEAAETFGNAARLYPGNAASAECLYLAGEALYRGGSYGDAGASYQRAIGAGGPFADDARLGLAWCKVKSGEIDAAISAFQDVAARHPESELVPQAELEAGRLLYRRERFDAAREQLDRLLQREVVPAEIRVAALELKGLACLDGGDAGTAAGTFRRALEAGPEGETRARLAYNLAEALAEQGEWQSSLEAYAATEEATEDASLAGDALYGASVALHRLGRHEDSIARAKRLVDHHPNHRLVGIARFAIGENYFALRDYRAADGFYAQVPEDHEMRRKSAFKRAWCAYLGGSHDLAGRRFEALTEGEDEIAGESLSMAALAWLQAGEDAKALAAADRYRARYRNGPHLARTERVAAQVLQRRGDFKGASSRIAAAAAAEQSGERAAEDRLQWAEMLFQQGEYAAARERYLELADRQDGVGARAVRGLAWCAFEIGNDEECITLVERALQHPAGAGARPSMLELLSSVHHRGKRWEEAEAAAVAFLNDHPKHPRAAEMRYALGVAQARAGKLRRARQTFESVGDGKGLQRPDRLFYELAWVCRGLEDEAAMLRWFARVASDSKDVDLAGEANLHLGKAALAKKQREEGRRILAKVKGKHEPQALYRIGFSFLEEQRPEEASPYFEAIVQMGPERTGLVDEALFLAGESRYLAGDPAGAVKRFRQLLARAPDHERAQRARLRLGESEFALNRPEHAVTTLEEFLRRGESATDADKAAACLWLGRARLARREHDRAEAAFQKVTDLSDGPLAAEAQFRLGESRHDRGDLDGAVDAFLRLAILYGHEEWVQRGLLEAGRCYVELEQPKKARKFLSELIERYPESASAKEARVSLKRLSGD